MKNINILFWTILFALLLAFLSKLIGYNLLAIMYVSLALAKYINDKKQKLPSFNDDTEESDRTIIPPYLPKDLDNNEEDSSENNK